MFLTGLIIGLCFVSCSYGKYSYETKYINVPLDHFSFFNNKTFQLRYLINDDYWRPSNGPIFLYVGNEGDIELFAQNTGFLWETAEKFNALIVFAEHRYYGRSLPPINDFIPSGLNSTNTSNPYEYYSYLTSNQVLADYVDVIYEVKNHQKRGRSYTGTQSNPVIAFGGSLGGMLAAWMKMKYPTVIEGALASSAPIFYFSGMSPCDGFNKVLTNVFNDTSPQCVQNIKKSWGALRKNVKQDNGIYISKNWNLCKPLESESSVDQLISVLSEVYSAVGMVNYPYPNDFLMPVPAYPVKEMCKYLDSSFADDKSLLNAIYKAISVYTDYKKESKCLDWTTAPYGSVDVKTWGVQACTEIVMPFCSNGVTDMFEPSTWDFKEISQQCYNYYGVTLKEKFIEKEYGGKDLRYASNIIFSNGLLDPWSSGGVTSKDAPSSVVVYDVADAAHHLDLRASHEKDPPSVQRARKLFTNIFRRWIRNYRKTNTNA